MGRPTIFDRPLTNYEMVKRCRQRQRGDLVAKPEMTDARKLDLARREIWHLQRRMRKLEEQLSDYRRQEYYLIAPLYTQIKVLKIENDRLRQRLGEPDIDPDA